MVLHAAPVQSSRAAGPKVGRSEAETEPETVRDRDSQRQRQTETVRDRDSQSQRQSETDRDRQRQSETETERDTDRETETVRDRDRDRGRGRDRDRGEWTYSAWVEPWLLANGCRLKDLLLPGVSFCVGRRLRPDRFPFPSCDSRPRPPPALPYSGPVLSVRISA